MGSHSGTTPKENRLSPSAYQLLVAVQWGKDFALEILSFTVLNFWQARSCTSQVLPFSHSFFEYMCARMCHARDVCKDMLWLEMCAKVCHAWKYVWEHVMTGKVCKDDWRCVQGHAATGDVCKDVQSLGMCVRACCEWKCVWGHVVTGDVYKDVLWLGMWGRAVTGDVCKDGPWPEKTFTAVVYCLQLFQSLSCSSGWFPILWEGLGNRWPTGYSSLLFATHLLVVYLCVDHYLIQKETSLMWTESFTHLRVRRLLLMEV